MDPGFLVDRVRELESLEKLLQKAGWGLVLVYGRRRVGKTRLLLEWIDGKPSVYYQAALASHKVNLEALAEAVEEQLGLAGFSGIGFRSLPQLVELAHRLYGSGFILVIDEFTYWARAYPGILSEAQYLADHVLDKVDVIVALTGSLVGFMEREVLGGGSPLYGRPSLRIRLGPLQPWCLPYFAPRYTSQELVELFSLVGGIPFYLLRVDDSRQPLEEFLRLVAPGGEIEDEPYFILRDEFREPHSYASVIRAVALGKRTLGEISSHTGLPLSHTGKYATLLVELGLLEAEPLIPRRRRRLYRVADRLLESYFTIIEPLRPMLVHKAPGALERAAARAVRSLSSGWEELARIHALSHLSRELGIEPSRAGRLLYKDIEVDYVIVDDDAERVLAVEAKWPRLDSQEIPRIRRRAVEAVSRVFPGYQVEVAIYAKERATQLDALVVTPDDLPWRRGCL